MILLEVEAQFWNVDNPTSMDDDVDVVVPGSVSCPMQAHKELVVFN